MGEFGWGGVQNLLVCQNTGSSAVHLECRPDIITACHLAPRQDCFTSIASFFSLYHSSRVVRECNYSVIMAVTTLLRHNLYG